MVQGFRIGWWIPRRTHCNGRTLCQCLRTWVTLRHCLWGSMAVNSSVYKLQLSHPVSPPWWFKDSGLGDEFPEELFATLLALREAEKPHINGLAQNCSNSSALAMKLLQSLLNHRYVLINPFRLNTMAAILHTTFSNELSWMKHLVFKIWSSFLWFN